MPSYIPITEGLCLVEQEVKTKKVVTKKGPVNHIWIFDRSGSMSGTLPELTRQLIKLSRDIPKGDALTLGWFSSEGGKFNWIFKGFKITENSDYKALEKAIKDNDYTIGLTCFSEILADTETVIKDLSVISKVFSLSFMSDGYPVVSNYSKETKNIFEAIKKIKGKIQSAILIGFGSYYNKELMAQMAEKLGAMLIHSSQVPEYAKSITKLIQLSENAEPKEEVEPLVEKPSAIFTITKQGVVIYAPDEDGKLYVSPSKDTSTFVYYLSTEKPNKKSWDKIEAANINFGDENDRLSKALYSAALIMCQQTKTDVALEIIGKTGDKAVIDGLSNSFLVEEYGAVETNILNAIQDVSQRFTTGRDPNYLPPPDAFCTFDLLNILTEDEEAAFFPYSEKAAYERIGVASTSKDGFPKFHADKTCKCPLNTLTWHESRLNLSVLSTIKGTVDLNDVDGKKPQDFGFSNPYPTFTFRNFTIIKDGHVHLKKFYVSTSDETYKILKNKGVVVDDTRKADGIFGLDISKLPAINRKIADGKTSAADLCKLALTEQKLKGTVKAIKWLKDDVLGDVSEKPASMTEEQAEFLKSNGILVDRGGLFQPPTDKEEAKDFYMAKTFEIKLSGIATLPTVKKVIEKIASGKSRTPVEALVEQGINKWYSVKASLKNDKAKLQWFKDTLVECQTEMKAARRTLQETKFSIILGRKWFDEFTSRENCELTVDGVKCQFVLGEEKVGY
jgi:hypothetical protein